MREPPIPRLPDDADCCVLLAALAAACRSRAQHSTTRLSSYRLLGLGLPAISLLVIALGAPAGSRLTNQPVASVAAIAVFGIVFDAAFGWTWSTKNGIGKAFLNTAAVALVITLLIPIDRLPRFTLDRSVYFVGLWCVLTIAYWRSMRLLNQRRRQRVDNNEHGGLNDTTSALP